MRDSISQALKDALRSGDKRRTSTLRLINAAINDRDIALRGKGKEKADDEEIVDILTKMVKQRDESARLYSEGGRAELAAQEIEEIGIIREFMPRQMDEAETRRAIGELAREVEAVSLRDMGKVMALARERFRGQMDMSLASAMLKEMFRG